ncbi:hypothetical protein [Mucisphaera sp.]|uniref:hypothetical protein n=1 Tax=Mucisphaera sp. TaxID=2913024 RepID=UPI003D0DF100
MTDAPRRSVSMVLGVGSLGYARLCLRSLLHHAIEPLRLRLITDNTADAGQLAEAVAELEPPERHRWSAHGFEELNDLAAAKIPQHRHVRTFMLGHPCWRKITDPLLLAEDGEEAIILDPDVFFPSPFTFEPTPEWGLLLMWQPPNCLLPPETVERAFELGPLADHTDIGVAHARAPLDWDWLDTYVQALGGADLPRSMHVESIVWAALALRIGGGYLDPARWWCYRSAQWKRVAIKLGVPGTAILRHEPLGSVKAFHAGGLAKHWLVRANPAEPVHPDPALTRPSPVRPFVAFPQAKHRAKLRRTAALRSLGYYRLLGSG